MQIERKPTFFRLSLNEARRIIKTSNIKNAGTAFNLKDKRVPDASEILRFKKQSIATKIIKYD